MKLDLLTISIIANGIANANVLQDTSDLLSSVGDELCPDSFKEATGHSVGILAFIILFSIGLCIVTYALVFMEDEPENTKSKGKHEYEPILKNIPEKHTVKKDGTSENSLRRRNV